jgi:hypothetical protein
VVHPVSLDYHRHSGSGLRPLLAVREQHKLRAELISIHQLTSMELEDLPVDQELIEEQVLEKKA